MSVEDLQAKGVAGINAFLAKNPSDLGVSADDISKMAGEQDRYVRDEKGTFIITRSYELGLLRLRLASHLRDGQRSREQRHRWAPRSADNY